MPEQYIISIDQSTQGTKALLFDERGRLVKRTDKSHEQLVNAIGWISHDPREIYENVIDVVTRLTKEVDKTKNYRCRHQQSAGDYSGVGQG